MIKLKIAGRVLIDRAKRQPGLPLESLDLGKGAAQPKPRAHPVRPGKIKIVRLNGPWMALVGRLRPGWREGPSGLAASPSNTVVRRIGDLNPGWDHSQTALAVRRHRPD